MKIDGDAMQRLAVVEKQAQDIPGLEKRTAALETNFLLLTKELETIAANLVPLTASINKLIGTLNAGKWVAITLLIVGGISVLGLKASLLAMLGAL